MNRTGKIVTYSTLVFSLCLAVTSSAVFAQELNDSERLRAEIRTAIMSDPRTQSLAEEEMNAMVEILAGETENQGAVYDFILPPPPFLNPSTFPIETPWGMAISPAILYLIILVSLALAGLILWWALHRHRVIHRASVA